MVGEVIRVSSLAIDKQQSTLNPANAKISAKPERHKIELQYGGINEISKFGSRREREKNAGTLT